MTATTVIDRLVVHPLARPDAGFAARLHAVALPHGFFARLGVPFLESYYLSFVASPHAVGYVASLDGRPVGLLVGTVRNSAHYRWVMRQRGWRLGLRAACALLARPRLAVHFLRTRSRWYVRAARRVAGGRGQTAGQTRRSSVAVLAHLCVAGEARDSGVGRALVDVFLNAVRGSGATEAMLVTLADDRGAAGFYDRLGWTQVDIRSDIEGRPVAVYRHPLRASAA